MNEELGNVYDVCLWSVVCCLLQRTTDFPFSVINPTNPTNIINSTNPNNVRKNR